MDCVNCRCLEVEVFKTRQCAAYKWPCMALAWPSPLCNFLELMLFFSTWRFRITQAATGILQWRNTFVVVAAWMLRLYDISMDIVESLLTRLNLIALVAVPYFTMHCYSLQYWWSKHRQLIHKLKQFLVSKLSFLGAWWFVSVPTNHLRFPYIKWHTCEKCVNVH